MYNTCLSCRGQSRILNDAKLLLDNYAINNEYKIN